MRLPIDQTSPEFGTLEYLGTAAKPVGKDDPAQKVNKAGYHWIVRALHTPPTEEGRMEREETMRVTVITQKGEPPTLPRMTAMTFTGLRVNTMGLDGGGNAVWLEAVGMTPARHASPSKAGGDQ